MLDLVKDAAENRGLEEKMVVIDALRNSGIPPEVFAPEPGSTTTANTVSGLFEEVSSICTSGELCSLLEGTPSVSLLNTIEIIIAEDHPELMKYFSIKKRSKKSFFSLRQIN